MPYAGPARLHGPERCGPLPRSRTIEEGDQGGRWRGKAAGARGGKVAGAAGAGENRWTGSVRLIVKGIDPAITGEPPEEQSRSVVAAFKAAAPSRTGRVRPVTAGQRAGIVPWSTRPRAVSSEVVPRV